MPRKTLAQPFHTRWKPVSGPLKTPCHIWQNSFSSRGYGQIYYRGRTWSAHRYSWYRANGPIPNGASILHKCDVPACVNPLHLFAGSARDNARDRDRKGRGNPPRGSRNHFSKITEADVARIKDVLRVGGATGRSIAKYFNVCPATISLIANGKQWKHV